MSRTDNLLFALRKQSQSVGHSKHVFVYPVYQLPIFIVSPDCLVRTWPCSHCGSGSRIQPARLRWRCLYCRVWRSYRCPNPAASDVLDGFSTPRNDNFLTKLPQILDSSEAFDNRLIVNSDRDGSRSVRSDDGGGKLHARGVVDGGTHSLLPVRLTAPRLRELYLDVVQRVRRCQSQRKRPTESSAEGLKHL